MTGRPSANTRGENRKTTNPEHRAPGSFAGFPEGALVFMRELNDNNNRVWFEANRQRYLESVLGPALALVVDLGRKLSEAFPPIGYDTRPNGGSLLRIHRDTRFSADKRPYK